MRFELFDLDAGDGVDAGLTWGSNSAFSQVDRQFGQGFVPVLQPDGSQAWTVSFSDVASASGFSFSDFASAAALNGGAAGTGNGGVSASAGTAGGERFDVLAYLAGDFILSANTELRVTGFAVSSVSGGSSASADVPDGVTLADGEAYSSANAYLDISLSGQSFNQVLSGSNQLPGMGPSGAYANSANASFSLVLRNEGASSLDGYFQALAQSSVMQLANVPVTPAVPEPAAWLTMSAGLLAVAAARRRRKA